MTDQTQKTRPILMSAPMVRAILEGRKTQTRRVIKLKFPFSAGIAEVAGYHMGTTTTPPVDMRVTLQRGVYHHMDFKTFAEKYCPSGQPGDRLWVKEKHRLTVVSPQFSIRSCVVQYAADNEELYRYECDHASLCIDDLTRSEKWKPSIFMPRWASRITLEITGVRVERLQAISEEDAEAEGVGHGFVMNGGWPDYQHIDKNGHCTLTQDSARMSYATLWDSINGKGAWDKNPWVWVISFCRETVDNV